MTRNTTSRADARRRAWLACLAMTTALCTVVEIPKSAGAEETQPVLAAQALSFDIAPQPLAEAIVLFGQQSGVQISTHGDLVRSLTSPGVTGTMTAEEGLNQLLAGTGITFHWTGANTVTLVHLDSSELPAPLAPLVIYGARTTQTLEDVTASVGIISEEEIERRKIADLRDSFRMTSNVRDSDWNDAGFVIRGINSEGLTPGGAPLASIYVDGVQQTVQGARRGARSLWDTQQVEIYKGPQSTLAGRAALAGAIYVKTNDPTYDLEAAGRVLGGTDERYGGAVMGNLPIIDDQFAVRVAAEYDRIETDIDYPTYTGFDRYDDLIEDQNFTIRGKALIEPEALPDLRALLSYSYSQDRPTANDIAGPGLGFEFDDTRGDFNMPAFAEIRETAVHNTGLEVTYDLTPDLVLTSQSSFSYSDTDRPSVNAGTEGETDYTVGDFIQKLTTQEFRLNYYGDSLEATLGVYAAYDDQSGDFHRPILAFGRDDISRSGSETWNAAIFGEGTFEFYPSWKFVLGGRYDYTQEDGFSYFERNGVARTDFNYSTDDSIFLPKIGLVKEFGPDHTVGFTVQRAFRAGGAGAQLSTGEVYEFDPETAWNYELSYKGMLFDDRLRLGANLFYLDLKDQQIEVLEDPLDATSAYVSNAGKSRAYGFELEAQAYATDELSGFLSVGYTNTKFKDFDSASVGDLTGLPFPEAPEWSIAAGVAYEHSSGFFVGLDAKYTDQFLARIGTDPQEMMDSYIVANAQVGFRYESLTLTVFAENVLDEEYFVYNDNDIAASVGSGRFVGASLDVKF